MLVAWRVKTWVEPFLYRVIFLARLGSGVVDGLPRFTDTALLRLIDNKRGAILGSTRHLIIQDPAYVRRVKPLHLCRLDAIMAACTGVTHLFLHSNSKLESHELAALGNLVNLRFLAIHLSKLFGYMNPMDGAHPALRNITHLEVLDTDHASFNWEKLAEIPNLTHLAFSEMFACGRLVEAFRVRSRLMDALVFLSEHDAEISVVGWMTEAWFIAVQLSSSNLNWQRGGLTGIDYWGAADRFIAERRAGRVSLEQYVISADDTRYFNICKVVPGPR
ncbi:Peptidylprolyl isomerase [Mycena venus]|uniref:Peptidylprolyl isomerase n=1 Tax=Mycena venus TaxID=2733690 RepID=A0A8H6Y4G1_9AGAR|nr:Peptidylprolyl isomerase [Mycena venus]